MKIAIASGKGGTGKTTVAAALALSLTEEFLAQSTLKAHTLLGQPPLFLDCDVEAPNAHLFLNPETRREEPAVLLIPEVDEAKCTHCGVCAQVCQYHAIAVVGKHVMVFPQLCHACGSCTLNCPEGAIHEVPHTLGMLLGGPAVGNIDFAQGVLNVGEPMAVPVITQLKRWSGAADGRVIILDSPPGASCPVVATLRGADYVVLVTEPTPFGLHDLRLAVEMVEALRIPLGVVINRDGMGDDGVDVFCRQHGLPVLMRIPFQREFAEGIARGRNLLEVAPDRTVDFHRMFSAIVEQIGGVSS